MAASRTTRINKLLDDEIDRTKHQLEDLGILNVTNMESQALIAEKNKRAKMSTLEVREFLAELRGLR